MTYLFLSYQTWVQLFAAECPVEYTHQWHGVIKNIVESRVNKVRFAHAFHMHMGMVAYSCDFSLTAKS